MLKSVGVACLAVVVCFGGCIGWQIHHSAQERKEVLSTLERQLPQERVHTSPISGNSERSMPVLNVDGRDYVGIVQLPDRGVRLPVLSDWSEESAHLTAGIYRGTASNGNLIIGAGNTPGQFYSLSQVDDGESAVFTDVTGAEYRYEVTSVETIETSKFETVSAHQEPWQLVLFAPSFSGIQQTVIRFKAVV